MIQKLKPYLFLFYTIAVSVVIYLVLRFYFKIDFGFTKIQKYDHKEIEEYKKLQEEHKKIVKNNVELKINNMFSIPQTSNQPSQQQLIPKTELDVNIDKLRDEIATLVKQDVKDPKHGVVIYELQIKLEKLMFQKREELMKPLNNFIDEWIKHYPDDDMNEKEEK